MNQHKALCSLRQAARASNEVQLKLFSGLRFFKSDFDEFLYTRVSSDSSSKIIVAYLADMLIKDLDESELRILTSPLEKHL